MFTLKDLERLQSCLIAFHTLAVVGDVTPFQEEGKDAYELCVIVSNAKANLRAEQEQQDELVVEHVESW